ncbi:hypothetical protein BH20ACT9_BH20ACT9_03030 [soil metagenome]
MDVRVTLLYFDDCPNWQGAAERLREAADRLKGVRMGVELRKITTAEQAEGLAFRGSPTILVDGEGMFADPDAPVGLCCRIHPTPGDPQGAPTVDELVEAVTAGPRSRDARPARTGRRASR